MNKKDKFFIAQVVTCILGILFGCFVIIYCFADPFRHSSYHVVNKKFGTDFYTASYAATKAAAENVSILTWQFTDISQIICFAVGAAFILGFLLMLFKTLSNHNRLKAEWNKAQNVNLVAKTINKTL